jgi:hypothetical protein
MPTKRAGRKSSGRRYSKGAGRSVERAMRKEKRGTLRRGKHGHGGRVTSRKQAIAIGLSEAREKGEKVPPRPRKRSTSSRSTSSRSTRGRKTSSRKQASRRK